MFGDGDGQRVKVRDDLDDAEEEAKEANEEEEVTGNEIYVWGGKYWKKVTLLLDDSRGQLGLGDAYGDDTYHPIPHVCSFGIIIK